MTKIDIFSGFLGAGKTTLIKKLIKEAYAGEKVVLIENEFGEIGIDGGFLQEAGINITEMNSGCICCSLVGDFSKALRRVSTQYSPDRIIIEPSGVGKLSDVIKAVERAKLDHAILNAFCTVVDASKCKMYMKNFGEFFNDQVQNASCIILSHTDKAGEDKVAVAVELLKEKNATATLVTASWDVLDGKEILSAMEQKNSLQADLDSLSREVEHHHEHECHDPNCDCHHHEHHHEHECHDPNCDCHHHGHLEHGHHADEVFTSWGRETTKKYTKQQLIEILESFDSEEKFGVILRAKGIVAGESAWLHFDFVPGGVDVREGAPSVTGRLCVIGCNLQEEEIEKVFNL